jgi:vitamin B12 transporter
MRDETKVQKVSSKIRDDLGWIGDELAALPPGQCRATRVRGAKPQSQRGIASLRNLHTGTESHRLSALGSGRAAGRPRRSLSSLLRPLLVLLSVLVIVPDIAAQSAASISGHVIDEHGANVTGAEVQLRSRSGAQIFAVTDDNGAYSFKNVVPAEYVLEVKAKGFANFTSNEISVLRGQSLTNDVHLSVKAVSESVVVTPMGTAQRVDETSKAVSLLDDQSIEAKRELTLAESLRGVPGIRVQQQGSFGALTTVRLRGQRNFDTAILLNGLRVRDASDINGSAVSVITDLLPVDLDRLEVLRGSGSSIYGTNAIGGVINLVPETGAGRSHFEFGFDGGSLALFRERIRGSGGLGKRAGYSFGVTRIDVRRGVDGNDQYGNTVGSGRLQFDLTPSVTLSANFYGTIANGRVNDSPFALPAAFAGGALYPRAVAGVTFQPDFNNPDQGRRNRVLVGSVKLSQQVNDKISYSIAYQHVGTRRRNYNGPRIDPNFAAFYPFGDFAFLSVNNGATDTLDARANLRLGRRNLATAGFEYERESIFQSFLPSFSSVNNTTDRQQTLAVFGQNQIFLLDNRLQISLGVRGQLFRVRAADRPEFLSAIKPENSITGDGSIAYFIRSTGTKLRAHAGNGFRAASLFERFGQGTFAQSGFARFGDPTLRAEQSISFDGGLDQRVGRDRGRFGVTYFYTHLQRVIAFKSFVIDPLGLGRFSGYVNQPGGISRGIESYLEAAPFRGADWRVSYTYTNSDRFVPARGLQPEYVIPKHLFGMTLNQRYRAFLISFDLNRTGAYIAPVFENNFPFRTAELTFSGYTKADLFASYEHTLSERTSVTLFGGADNIFAEKYFENGFRAPGAVGRGGISFRF